MAIDLGHANVKDQKHVTRLAPKNYQEKWLPKVMLGLCSRLTGWGVLKPHSQLTQAAIHHALNFNLPKDNETSPAMQGHATVGSAELKTISNVLSDRSAQKIGKGDADRQASLFPIYTSDQTKRKSGENPQRMHLLSHKGRAAEGPSSNPWQTKNTQCIKGTKGKDRVVPLELSGRLTQQSLAVANPWGLYNSLRRMPLSQTPKISVKLDHFPK